LKQFARSFAGRDDASEKDCRMAVGLENHQAHNGNMDGQGTSIVRRVITLLGSMESCS